MTTNNLKRWSAVLLLTFCSLGVRNVCQADEPTDEPADGTTNTPVELSIGTLRTEAELAAIGIAIKYLKELDVNYFFGNFDKANNEKGRGWILDLYPEIEIQTGEADSFNAVVVKVRGNYMSFKKINRKGIITPDTSRAFSIFPVSFGVESNRNFESSSLLLEVGYVPFNPMNNIELGTSTKLGLFLQAGYKFEVDDTPVDVEGGAEDESEEVPDSEIARLKFDLSTSLLSTDAFGGYNVALIPSARGWYDIANEEFYHKLEADISISLDQGRTLNFKYEKGSGSPNFNEGSQFGTYIKLLF